MEAVAQQKRGKALGISFETYYTYKMKYNATAQRFVLDHMEEITRPSEHTWGWGGWQPRRTSSSWASDPQSSARSYAESAWKGSTADESRAGDGVAHPALQSPRAGYPQSKAGGSSPAGGYTAAAPLYRKDAATASASTGEANGTAGTSREKLHQAAHSVLD